MYRSLLVGFALTASAAPSVPKILPRAAAKVPTVTVKNGSYYGTHLPTYDEDVFLGMPFAYPPLEDLRFRNPQSLNTTWSGVLPATDYAAECIGYGSDQIGHEQSEDCLYLNVVRPSGYENSSLPVLVWIHGGGFFEGGTQDQRYNLSFVVQNSVEIGKPIIAASAAYRLGPFGFMNSDEIMGAGQTNLGLKDQRLALHWIQENIAAFGGNPDKVTIWGQSAGAESVGFHIRAFNGRNDNLFRAAVMESGPVIPHNPLNGTDSYQPRYEAIVEAAGCETVHNLDCLRKVPFTKLNSIFNTTEFDSGWSPTIDGDFVARYASEQLSDGAYVKVPIIVGTTSDEGTTFAPTEINSTADFVYYLNTTTSDQWAFPEYLVKEVLQDYPNDPAFGIPSLETLGGNVTFPAPYGAEYRRSAAYWGDQVFIAGRRWTSETWASKNLTAYSYRFNTVPAGASWESGVTHFADVAFFFNNLEGLGYSVNPFQDKPESYVQLSYLMSNSLVSFVHDLNPNNWTGLGRNATRAGNWPSYDIDRPLHMVWDANITSYAELDTFRAEGIKLINANAVAYHR